MFCLSEKDILRVALSQNTRLGEKADPVSSRL